MKTMISSRSHTFTRITLGFLCSVMVFSVLLGLFHPQKANAAEPAADFVDAFTVNVTLTNSAVYLSGDAVGDDFEVSMDRLSGNFIHEFSAQNKMNGVELQIVRGVLGQKFGVDLSDDVPFYKEDNGCLSIVFPSTTNGVLLLNPWVPELGSCLLDAGGNGDELVLLIQNSSAMINSIGNTDVSDILFHRSEDKSSMTSLWMPGENFTVSPSQPDLYIRDSEQGESCSDRIIVNGDHATIVELTDDHYDVGSHTRQESSELSGCYYADRVGKRENGRILENSTAPSTNTDASGNITDSTDIDVNCEAISSGGGGLSALTNGVGHLVDSAISWIMCPLIDGSVAIINGVGNAVIDQLIVKPEVLDTRSEAGNAVHTAWNDFRIISLSLLILVALVGIAAGSFIDAYTLKKIVPRMLIAIIAITLSWDLLKLALGVTNAIGIGVRALIFAPFQSIQAPTISPAGILAGIGGVGFVFGLLGTLSFVGTAALAVLTAFVFTSIRYVAIIAFIIAAPVAIMASILPGTEKIWKIWKDGLIGALAMLPLVTGMLAIGASLGKVVAQLQGGPFGQFMSLIVTFGPYFLIPKAFSVAGGLVSNLSGMVNDRGKGAFDRVRNFRQNQAKKIGEARKERIKAQKAFKGGVYDHHKKNLRGRLNYALQTAALAPEADLGFRPNRWMSNINADRAQHVKHAADEAVKDPLAAVAADDAWNNAMLAWANGGFQKGHFERYLQHFGGTNYGTAQYRGGVKSLDNLMLDAPLGDQTDTQKANMRDTMDKTHRLSRKYDAETLRFLAGTRNSNNSTAYLTDVDADGNFIGRSGQSKMMHAIMAASGGDEELIKELIQRNKQGQSAAGITTNDASFSAMYQVAQVMKEIETKGVATVKNKEGEEITVTKDSLENYITDTLVENVADGQVMQRTVGSGKGETGKSVRRMSQIKKRKLQQKQEARQPKRVALERQIAELPNNGTLSDSDKAAAMAELNRQLNEINQQDQKDALEVLAFMNTVQSAIGTSSADVRAEASPELQEKVGISMLPPSLQEHVSKKITLRYADPKKPIDPTDLSKGYHLREGITPDDIKEELGSLNYAQLLDSVRDHPDWQSFFREYGVQMAAQQASMAAAEAAAGGATGPVQAPVEQ